MIPIQRPVLGSDLDDVRQQFGLSVGDAIWLFGLSITRWTEIVRKGAEEPVRDPTLALLVRLLDAFPTLNVIPMYPTPTEMYDLLAEVTDMTKKKFSIFMGNESSGGYRWMTKGSRPSPALLRLMYFLKIMLTSAKPEERTAVVEGWMNIVNIEASARGSNDVFHTGRWSGESARRFTEQRKAIVRTPKDKQKAKIERSAGSAIR